MRALLIVGIVCLVAACGGASPKRTTTTTTTTTKAPYASLLGAGMALLRQGNTNAAVQLFTQAAAKNPRDPVAHYDLGVAYQSAGDRRNALAQYHKALAINARYVPAMFNEAILVTPVDRPLAMFLYRQVTALAPRSSTAFLNLGLLEARSPAPALHRRAIRDLSRAVALDPSLAHRIPRALRNQVKVPPTAH